MKSFQLVTFSFTAILVIILCLSGALRMYFDDTRLQNIIAETMRKELHLELAMKDFHLRLFKGIEARDISIKPASLNAPHPLHIKRAEIVWSPWSLFKGQVVIKRIHIENPIINIIDTKLVQNFVVATTSKPPKQPEPPKQPKVKKPKTQIKTAPKKNNISWSPPDLPITVQLVDFALHGLEAKYQNDTYVTLVRDINLKTHLTLSGTQLKGGVVFLTGQKNSTPNLIFEMPEKNFTLKTFQNAHLKIAIDSYQNIKTDLDYKSTNAISHEKLATQISLSHTLSAISNIEKQHLDIQKLTFAIGDFVQADLQLSLSNILSQPHIAIKQCQANLNGEQAQKAISAVFPKIKMQGHASFAVEPTTIDIASLNDNFNALQLKMTAQTKQLTLSLENFGFKNHNLTLTLDVNNGESRLQSKQTIERLSLPEGSVENISLSTSSAFTLKDIAQAIKTNDPPFQFNIQTLLTAHQINIKPLKVKDFELTNKTSIPLQYLLSKNPLSPLESSTQVTFGNIAAPPLRIKTSQTTLELRLWDKTLQKAGVSIQGKLKPIYIALEEPLWLSHLKFNLTAQKDKNTLTLSDFKYNLANLLKGSSSLKVTEILSSTPQISNARFALEPLHVEKVAKTFRAMLPQGQYKGTLSGDLDLNMRIPNSTEIKALSLPTSKTLDSQTMLYKASQAFALLYQKLDLKSHGRFNIENLSLELPGLVKFKKLNLLAITMIGAKGLELKSNMRITEFKEPAQFNNFSSRISLMLNKNRLTVDPVISLSDYLVDPELLPLKKIKTSGRIEYSLLDEIVFNGFSLHITPLNISGTFSGNILNSLTTLAAKDPAYAAQNKLQSNLKGRLAIANSKEIPLLKDNWKSQGDLSLKGELHFENGLLKLDGALNASQFRMSIDDMALDGMSGKLPYTLAINLKKHPLSIPIVKNMGLSQMPIGLQTPKTALKRGNTQTSYFSRQDSYANQSGLFIRSIEYGHYKIKSFLLDASLNQTSLNARHFAMNVLGGDIMGNAALQLNADKSIAGIFNTQVSNIDASYFPALEMKPGKESELSANVYTDFLLGPSIRDLNMDMNVTKIGSKTLNRFVLLLDPDKKDKQLQANRKNLRWIQIDQVNTWIRRENLNMDLYYTALLRIPWTQIGFRPINTEMLRRYPLSEFMNAHIQGQKLKPLRKALGW